MMQAIVILIGAVTLLVALHLANEVPPTKERRVERYAIATAMLVDVLIVLWVLNYGERAHPAFSSIAFVALLMLFVALARKAVDDFLGVMHDD